MGELARRVYVISDLHIGGAYGDAADPEDRGFRIATHVAELTDLVRTLAAKPARPVRTELVINGDFVDFLAEREDAAPHWQAFTPDPAHALAKLDAIIARDQPLFDALRDLVAAGHRLVILLGNHDIELSFPVVRNRLRQAVGADGGADFLFTYDGEAYAVGDALIEHGNRYDGFNVVDMNELRQVRSMQSRGKVVPERWAFEAPPGSFMVAQVINPIKQSYRFVDLLKPETGAVLPILLALEPGYRKIAAKAAQHALRAKTFKLDSAAQPSMGGDISSMGGMDDPFGGDISSAGGATPSADDAALDAVLRDALGSDADAFKADIQQATQQNADPLAQLGGDISSASDAIDRTLGLAQLLLSRGDGRVEARLPALLRALRALQSDQTWDESVETEPAYLDAAREICDDGYRYVVFGHTHLAKKIDLGGGRTYLNSGTWADLIRFPTEILSGDQAQSLAKLAEFVDDLKHGRLARWIVFQPSYVRLDVGADERVVTAELCHYEKGADV